MHSIHILNFTFYKNKNVKVKIGKNKNQWQVIGNSTTLHLHINIKNTGKKLRIDLMVNKHFFKQKGLACIYRTVNYNKFLNNFLDLIISLSLTKIMCKIL